MGRNMVELTVTARLSSHNSEQDDIDLRAWERFAALVRELADREEFKDISLDVSGGSW
jgi:hypothetical protein